MLIGAKIYKSSSPNRSDMAPKTTSGWLKLAMAILETIFAIPIFGGTLILALLWTPLGLALIGHIVTLVFSKKENKKITPSVLGIVASVLGFIPIIGWILHIIAAIFNWIGAFKD